MVLLFVKSTLRQKTIDSYFLIAAVVAHHKYHQSSFFLLLRAEITKLEVGSNRLNSSLFIWERKMEGLFLLHQQANVTFFENIHSISL